MSYVLELQAAEDLRHVYRGHFAGDVITAGEFDHMLRLCDGLWQHNGDPSAPHAELTSGNCSDGFANTLLLLKYANINMLLAEELVRIYRESTGADPDWVVGSDHAAASLSAFVAYHLRAKHEFTEKVDKTQLWKRETIGPDETVLQVEELVTTLATLERVRQGIVSGNTHPVTFADVSLTLVHRSPSYEFGGRPILYLRHYDISVWEPEECPLCAAGSERLRPKENWDRLTAA